MTPLHYDQGENLLLQVSGVKKVYMWSPSQWGHVSPLPLPHPSVQGSAIEDIWDTANVVRVAPSFGASAPHVTPYSFWQQHCHSAHACFRGRAPACKPAMAWCGRRLCA